MKPLRRVQIVILSGVAILAVVAANLAWLLPTLEELETNAYLLHRAIALDAKNQIANFLSRQERALENSVDILNQGGPGQKELISRLLKENPPLESLGLLDLAGNEILKSHRFRLITQKDLKNRSGEELFKSVKEGKVYKSPVLVSGISEPLLTLVFPLSRASGLSALVAEINLKFLLEVVRSAQVLDQGAAYVVDREGFIIAHPDSSLVFGRANVLSRRIVAKVLGGEEADSRTSDFSYENEAGKEVFALALPFESAGWAVLVESPRSVALAASGRILNVALVSFGLEIFLVALLIWNYLNLAKTAQLFWSERNQREAILASLSDGVIEYDQNLKVTLINPRAEELLGIKFSEIKELHITPELAQTRPQLKGLVELMYPALAPYASPAKEIPGSPAKAMEMNLSEPQVKLWVTLTQVQNRGGEVIGFLKILRDISREELIGRLKSEFVSIAAHQLRTPLSALKWTLRLLLDGDAGELTASQEEFLEKGYVTNERMIKLVSDLLNVARIEEGKFGYQFEEVDLKSLLESAVGNFLPSASEHKISLRFEKPSEILPAVYADPEKLLLALSNLLDNALKYTSSGGRVTLILRRKGEFAEISIADTGVGIPPGEEKRVFSKFFRASNVLKMETEGTGLGLFIVKNVIRRHGGNISFSSTKGEGSTFTFTLPLKKELVPTVELTPLEEFLGTI